MGSRGDGSEGRLHAAERPAPARPPAPQGPRAAPQSETASWERSRTGPGRANRKRRCPRGGGSAGEAVDEAGAEEDLREKVADGLVVSAAEADGAEKAPFLVHQGGEDRGVRGDALAKRVV